MLLGSLVRMKRSKETFSRSSISLKRPELRAARSTGVKPSACAV